MIDSEFNAAIFSMFCSEPGQVVLKELEEKLKEPSYRLGEPTETAIYREGSRNTLSWLIGTYNYYKANAVNTEE